MTSQRRSTAKDLIQQLMKTMSMTVPTTIAGATDKRTVQFWELANEAGQQLANMNDHHWQILLAEHTITTQPNVSSYTVPDDLIAYYEDSEWNRTTRLPVLGALTEVEWQMLKARNVSGTTFTALFRINEDSIEFYNTPTSAQTIVLPYTSRNWVLDKDLVTRKDHLENDGDVILFDPQLFKAKLRLRWKEEKGFDTTKDERNFMRELAQAKGNDKPGRTLSLIQRGQYPYLGSINVPDTNYGSA